SLTMQISGLGSVSKSPDKQSYVYGEQVVLEASPEDGWIFKGWGGDVSGSDLTVLLTMTDNFTVYAQFEELKYYVPLIIAE
ncbi:MAG: InlB B-repeat-containing protein, partial [Anaerolineales bacterium]